METSNIPTTLTPELALDENSKLFLIRNNLEELLFVKSIEDAIVAIDSIADHEQKRLTKELGERTRVFRQDFDDGKRVIISVQQKGYIYDGSIEKKLVLDYVQVSLGRIIKSRLPVVDVSVDSEISTEMTTSLYLDPELIAKLAIQRNKSTGESNSPSSETATSSASDDE